MDIAAFPAEKDQTDDENDNIGDQIRIGTADHADTQADNEHPVEKEVANGIDQRDDHRHLWIPCRYIKTGKDVIDKDQRDIPDTDGKKCPDIWEKYFGPAQKDDHPVQKQADDQRHDAAEDRCHDHNGSEISPGFFIFPFTHFR